MLQRRIFFLWSIPLLLLLVACLMRVPDRPLSDFAGYYFGGRELLHGTFMNAYDMELLNRSIAAQGFKDVYVSYAPFPPFSSLVFAPFLLLPVVWAKLVFDVFCCVLFVWSLFRAFRFFHLPAYLLLLVPAVFCIPVINNVFFGQSYLLLFCLLLEGYMAHQKKQLMLSSFCWAFAILFKLFPAVIFIYLLLRRQWKAGLYLGIASGALLLLSVVINGPDVWKFYISEILPKLNAGELNDPFTTAFQSFFMLCKRAFVQDALLNPQPAYANLLLFRFSTGLYKALMLSLCVMYTIREKQDDFQVFALWLLTSMLVSPNGSSYSLVLLLIPFLAVWSADQHNALRERVRAILLSVLLLAACNIPAGLFAGFPLLLQFPRLLLLLGCFACLLYGTRKLWHPILIGLLALLFVGPALKPAEVQGKKSSYLLTEGKDLFIYDFGSRSGHLVYYSWDGNKRETKTQIPVVSFTRQGFSVRDNQIYLYDRQITHSPDWKRKPALINGNTIVYLSDQDRGICFYTLRQIPLR